MVGLIGRLNAAWLLNAVGIIKPLANKTFDFMPYTPVFNVTRPARHVSAALLERGGAADWDALCGALWRRSHAVPPGGPTGARPAVV